MIGEEVIAVYGDAGDGEELFELQKLVRCKECKHGTYCEEAEMYICNANDQDLYEAEHFCSYGEREGE